MSPEELRALQLDRLQALLAHAYARVPFYRQRFDAVGVRPDDIRSLGDLQRLPVLTKDDLRAHAGDDDMIAAGVRKETLRRNATGGSTGAPVAFYDDGGRMLYGMANKMRYRRWYGYESGDRVAFLWGAPHDWYTNWRGRLRRALRRERRLDACNISEENMRRFVAMLGRWHPALIIGYVSVLDLVAGHMRKAGIPPIRPQAVEPSAEKLWPHQRPRIEAAFGAPVYDLYGSREFGPLAAECEARDGLHVLADTFVLEVVKNGRPAAPDELGEILVTSFTNWAMPLIRYQIGDLGRLHDDAPCACGRGLPRLAEVVGRTNDLVTTPDGRYIHSVFFSRLFFSLPGIKKYRVHQKSALEIHVTYESEAPAPPAFEARLRQRILDNVGQEVDLSIEHVEAIPPLPSGKLGYIVSDTPVDFVHG